MPEITKRGGQEWVVHPGELAVPRRLAGAQLLGAVQRVQDGPSACQVAADLGWLQRPDDLGEVRSAMPSWRPGAPGNASDYDFDAPARWEGEPLARWVAAGELVRSVRQLLGSASALARGGSQELDRRKIREHVLIDGTSVEWVGMGNAHVYLPKDTAPARWWARVRKLGNLSAEDAELAGVAFTGVGLELAWYSRGHFGLRASVPGLKVPEPQPLDLYGAILLALEQERARAVAGLGNARVVRCARCGKPVVARRTTRVWCSDSCRVGANDDRRREERRQAALLGPGR